MLRSVAVPLIDNLAMFEFGLLCEVFGSDRSYANVPRFDFRICALEPMKPLASANGTAVIPPLGLEAMDDVDLIAVPAADIRDEYPEELLEALRRASARGATILTVCSGAFIVGAAGLLDGRACTTHWRHAEALQERFPLARVDAGALFVDDGDLITSAGTAAGIDASLHLVRRELGSSITNVIARNMVVPPQRDGGQRQYIERPAPEKTDGTLVDVLAYLGDHLEDPHTVSGLAHRAGMSQRSFARRFVGETGVTPMQWIARQRILHARLLLETTDLPIERVAQQSGFASATLLRHHFDREVGVAPSRYRMSFTA